MASFLEAFQGHLESMNTLPDDRETKGVFHPSELPRCARKLYYSYIDAPSVDRIPADVRLRFEHGKVLHSMFQSFWEDYYGPDFQREVPFRTEHPILGKCDGTLIVPSDPTIKTGVELKSTNQKGFRAILRSGPMEDHVMQTMAYAGSLKLPFMHIIYYNKNDEVITKPGDVVKLPMKEFIVKFDPVIWSLIERKIQLVKDCAEKNQPPPQEISYSCKTCKFLDICKPELPEKGGRLV